MIDPIEVRAHLQVRGGRQSALMAHAEVQRPFAEPWSAAVPVLIVGVHIGLAGRSPGGEGLDVAAVPMGGGEREQRRFQLHTDFVRPAVLEAVQNAQSIWYQVEDGWAFAAHVQTEGDCPMFPLRPDGFIVPLVILTQ